MSTPIISTHTSTHPDLPAHSFRLVKVIETSKDAHNRDVHHLIVYLETLIDGVPQRTKVTTLTLRPGDTTAAPTLTCDAYIERDHTDGV